MKLPAYPGYKASGVAWLGDVPGHWEVRRLKTVARLTDRKVEADGENPVPYVGMENIESWTGRLLPLDPDMVPTGTANAFKAGSLLFGKLRPYLAKACIPDFGGLCSTELLVVNASGFYAPALLYVLLSQGFINTVNSSTFGSKMPRADWEFVGGCRVPVPPSDEQQAITDFLDRETARLDTLMRKKRELIGKLKEKRTALISRTVTRGLPPAAAVAAGLDPHSKLKPSGIEWLCDLPEHWGVKRFRRLIARLEQGWSPIASNYPANENELGVLKFSAVIKGKFVPRENRTLDELPDGMVIITPAKGALLISRSNTPELVGEACVVEESYPTLIIPDLIYRLNLKSDDSNSEFVCWFLLSRSGRAQIESDARGSSGSMVKLGQGHLRAWAIPQPPLPEQHAIAAYLDHETAKLDALTAKVEVAITRLQEYRTALINAAVTDKIDVRNHS